MKKLILILLFVGIHLLSACNRPDTAEPTRVPENPYTPTPIVVPTCTPEIEPVSPTPLEQQANMPSPTPIKVSTPTPTVTPEPLPTAKPTPTAEPEETPIPSPTLTEAPTPKPTKTPKPSPTSEPTKTPTSSPMLEPTETPTPSPTPEPTETPTPSPTVTPEPMEMPTPNPTVAPQITETPTPGPVVSPEPTETPATGLTPVPTEMPVATATPVPVTSVEKLLETGWQMTESINGDYKIIFPELFDDAYVIRGQQELVVGYASTKNSELAFYITYTMRQSLEETLQRIEQENGLILSYSAAEKSGNYLLQDNDIMYQGVALEVQYTQEFLGTGFGGEEKIIATMQVIFVYPKQKEEYMAEQYRFFVIPQQ